jgi:hypothetical protein
MVLTWIGHALVALLVTLIAWPITRLFGVSEMYALVIGATIYPGREFGEIGDKLLGRLPGWVAGEGFGPIWGEDGVVQLDNIGDASTPIIAVLLVYGWWLGMIW